MREGLKKRKIIQNAVHEAESDPLLTAAGVVGDLGSLSPLETLESIERRPSAVEITRQEALNIILRRKLKEVGCGAK